MSDNNNHKRSAISSPLTEPKKAKVEDDSTGSEPFVENNSPVPQGTVRSESIIQQQDEKTIDPDQTLVQVNIPSAFDLVFFTSLTADFIQATTTPAKEGTESERLYTPNFLVVTPTSHDMPVVSE